MKLSEKIKRAGLTGLEEFGDTITAYRGKDIAFTCDRSQLDSRLGIESQAVASEFVPLVEAANNVLAQFTAAFPGWRTNSLNKSGSILVTKALLELESAVKVLKSKS